MNQFNHTIQSIMIITVMMMLVSGCRKFVTVEAPIDRLVTTTVFESDASASSAVTGIYAQMQGSFPYMYWGGVTINAALTADELNYTGASADLQSFYSNSILPTSNINNSDLWQRAWSNVYHVNAAIEGLRESRITPSVREQLMGELQFLRGYFYFYLVNLYGDVPLITTTNYAVNAVLPRAPAGVVYDSIEADLQVAADLLKDAISNNKARPNRHAAKAMLARVYLYRGKWQEAEAKATEVIGSGSYSLVANLNNVFLANSNEAIWQLRPVSTTQNTIEGNRLIPASATALPAYVISPGLFNAFTLTDLRKASWMKSNTVAGTPRFYPFKYKVRTGTTVTEQYMMLRFAELYLIRAEARAQQDKLALAKADVDVIRNRAGLAGVAATNKDEMLDAIAHERRLEFFAEWGHRWLDLKRTGKADVVLSVVKNGWQPTDVLYPIPAMELLVNVALTQNAGY